MQLSVFALKGGEIMSLPGFRVIVVGFLFLFLTGIAMPQSPLSRADFERLHKELFASKEAWQEIPWRLSILEAQAAAVKEKKPIYMLVRSGHPLGCV